MPQKMIKIFSAVLAVLCCFTGCSSSGTVDSLPPVTVSYETSAVVEYTGTFTPTAAVEGMELVAQKGYTALYADMATGNFAVEDMRTGVVYHSAVPGAETDELATNAEIKKMQSTLLLTVLGDGSNVTRTLNSYKSAYEQGEVRVQKTDDGIQIWYLFGEEKLAIPVEISLCEDGFRARVLCDHIKEQGTTEIYGISVLPYMFAQPGNQDGYMLVPDGSGSLIYLRSQKESYGNYRATLYGEEYLTVKDYSPSVGENLLLPMIGMQAANGAFLAVAEKGAEYGIVNAAPDGLTNQYNNVYFGFTTRNRQTSTIGAEGSFYSTTVTVNQEGPIGIGDISVRYYLLDSQPANGLQKMAEVGRSLAAREATVQSPASSPLYLSVLGSYPTTKSIGGVRVDTVEVTSSVEDTAAMLAELKAANVKDPTVLYSGFEKGDSKGQISASLKVLSKVGSYGSLSTLSEQLGSDRLYLSYDPVIFSKSSSAASNRTDVVLDLSLNACVLPVYKRSTLFPDNQADTRYLLKMTRALSLVEQVSSGLAEKLPETGLLVENWGDMLYADYSENGYGRNQAAQAVADTLRKTGDKLSVATSNANWYAAVVSSVIVDVPSGSNRYLLLDEDVPFYQMVLGGTRQIVSRPLNATGEPEKAFLEAIKCGMVPQMEVVNASATQLKDSGLDTFYGAVFTDWKDFIVEKYVLYAPLYEAIRGQAMADFQILAKGVYQITYANGTEVLVNQSAYPYEWNTKTVAAAGFAYQQAGR